MQTSLDCLICFMKQARSTGKLATDDPVIKRRIIEQAGNFLATVDSKRSPPENAIELYAIMSRELGLADPFALVKKSSNDFGLAIKDDMEQRIGNAEDPLLAAIRGAIGGNIIDYAAQHVFDIEQTMDQCLSRTFAIDDYDLLQEKIADIGPEDEVLYLCDNCGEIVFDGLLIRQLQKCGCRVTAAVRGFPIINDATMEDAEITGLDTICRVISNGTSCPGTPLESCNEEFKERFLRASIIISKGMGNYETLSEVKAPIFFLFTVKCSVVASHVSRAKNREPGAITGTGEMVLLKG